MTPIDYIRIDAEILRLKISDKGKFLLGLVKRFNSTGLKMSNQDLAELLGCSTDNIVKVLREINSYIRIENAQSRYRKVFYSGENGEVETDAIPRKLPSKEDSTQEFETATQENRTATPSKITDIIEIKKDNIYVNQFEQARKKYPGTKRGLNTEYKNFKKKHTDWKKVLPLLEPAIGRQIEWRMRSKATNRFVPEWKNFKTWINNRCWEDEVSIKSSTTPFDTEAAAQREQLRRCYENTN